MTLQEIRNRKDRYLEAQMKANKAKYALEQARAEYADEQAQKAGITYNRTKVILSGSHTRKGPFMVSGYSKWFFGEPRYHLVKIKKDGTASKSSAGFSLTTLDEIEVVA